jgi:hypothetical protein
MRKLQRSDQQYKLTVNLDKENILQITKDDSTIK